MGHADDVPIVARDTGRLLSTLVHAMQPNRILEIGTADGYSPLWMALAMPPAGKLGTIDPDTERTSIALE
ncbi:MAG: O-methyltransferase, partial [Candidatus Eremiobacteraeota bacterium]|nr:O-methyltransferase [Candidatus Eremiobacteraeota bacterium]